MKLNRRKPSKPATFFDFFSGEISWETPVRVYDRLMAQWQETQFKRLIMAIASPGGELDAAWALYAALNALPFTIDTVAVGRVYSAATILYMIGESRYAFPESIFLFHPVVHEGYTKRECSTQDLEEAVKGAHIDREHFARVVSKKATKAPKEFIDGIVKPTSSIYLNTTQAHTYGIVTKVVNKFLDIT